MQPSTLPSNQPSTLPSNQPSTLPSTQPSTQPSAKPTVKTPLPTPGPGEPTIAPTTAAPTAVLSAFPYYSASNTNSATQNTVDQTIYMCSGSTVTFDLCGCSGDTYLRLYNTAGSQAAYDDDSGCGLCSAFSYYTGAEACQTYVLKQGCYDSGSCGGTVAVTVTSKYANTRQNGYCLVGTNSWRA